MDRAAPVPTRRDLLLILLAALLLRGAAMVTMGLKAHDLAHLPTRSDGSAYVDNAKRINGEGMPSAYDRRVFVGYPWVIAMGHRVGLPYGWGAMAIALTCSGLLCAATAAWLKDGRIGWAMAVLPPHWVLDTAAVLNESMMLLLCVAAMWTMRKPAWWGAVGAALLFAAAGMVRPMACFAVAGALAALLQAGLPRRAALLGVLTGVAFAAMFFAFKAAYWNPLDNARQYREQPLAYHGQVFTYPFGSVVEYARARGVLRPNFLYKAAYLVAGVAVMAYAVRRWAETRRPLDAWAATWWGLNTVFVLCIGSHWGVDIAQRSLMWAAPAAYWTLREWLPMRGWVLLLWALLPVPWVFVTSQG